MGYPPSKMGFEPSSPRYGPFLEWAQQPSPARHVCRSVTCHGALWGGGPSSFGFFMCYRCCYKVVGTPHTPYLAGFHFGVSPSGHPRKGKRCCWAILREKLAFGQFFQILLAGATCMLPYRAPHIELAPHIEPAPWYKDPPCFAALRVARQWQPYQPSHTKSCCSQIFFLIIEIFA